MAAEKFSEVYVALLQATPGDSLPPAQADSVFQARGVAAATFRKASQYYSAQPERWSEVLKLVVARLDSAAAAETKKTAP